VTQTEASIRVTFYVYTGFDCEQIIQQEDVFPVGGYSIQTYPQVLARGQRGFTIYRSYFLAKCVKS